MVVLTVHGEAAGADAVHEHCDGLFLGARLERRLAAQHAVLRTETQFYVIICESLPLIYDTLLQLRAVSLVPEVHQLSKLSTFYGDI